MTQKPVTDERLAEFVGHLTADRSMGKFARQYGPVTLERGQKNVRVVVENCGSRSVYCFIEIATGNIMKSASWKTPAKGVRGNIWNDRCDVGTGKPCDVHGTGLYRR